KSFNLAKTYLTTYPILRMYNPKARCYLFTDASRIGLGAVLKQPTLSNSKDEPLDEKEILKDINKNNILKPIGYFSKKLKNYEQNYYSTELEFLAILKAIENWHHYLYGTEFTIITDHRALKWLTSFDKSN